ncbi:MAG TPA: hypothetical protein DCZ03_04805 [Gammaproteobacteria bacterium]|nr:hypothetical protein [Gammaproteobacteria bacterium]
MPNVILESILTCPECGQQKKERMPTNACLWFYECSQCGQLLRPISGDCCVFCSYGTVKCPPVQQGDFCCG